MNCIEILNMSSEGVLIIFVCQIKQLDIFFIELKKTMFGVEVFDLDLKSHRKLVIFFIHFFTHHLQMMNIIIIGLACVVVDGGNRIILIGSNNNRMFEWK